MNERQETTDFNIQKEADMAMDNTTTTETATLTPRQRVAAMIDDLAASGCQGEHILQHIERQIAGFSTESRKLAFFWSKFTEAEMSEAT